MSASISSDGQDPSTMLAIGSRFPDRVGWCDDRPLVSPQFGVVREMLSTLDNLTAAGQQYVMRKVVTFLRDQVAREWAKVSHRNQRALADLVAHLTHESERAWPDPGAFSHRAQNLVMLLAAGA